jgi:hypothetical protein
LQAAETILPQIADIGAQRAQRIDEIVDRPPRACAWNTC